LRAASTRVAPFFDRDEVFAFEARGFATREALAPFDDFAALDLRAFDGLRFVALPRALAARVFVSAMLSLRICSPIACLKDAGTRDEKDPIRLARAR
jgi:hypothetical protein